MNRVIVKLNEHGEFDGYVSDMPIELIVYDPNCKDEPFYHYRSGRHGVQHVRGLLGDSPIAYGGVDFLMDYNGSKPHIGVVKGDSDE